MRKSRFSVLLALASIATVAGCRSNFDSQSGRYDWSLGESLAAADCPPSDPAHARRKCPPGSKQGLTTTEALSVDAPTSSELVPLPTRPVFGARMDGRQAGMFEPASAKEPAAEQIPTPPPSTPATGTSLKLRRRNPPSRAAQ